VFPTHGDLNGDGDANAVDLQSVINAALGLLVPFNTDIALDDGRVNAVDVQMMINILLGIA